MRTHAGISLFFGATAVMVAAALSAADPYSVFASDLERVFVGVPNQLTLPPCNSDRDRSPVLHSGHCQRPEVRADDQQDVPADPDETQQLRSVPRAQQSAAHDPRADMSPPSPDRGTSIR